MNWRRSGHVLLSTLCVCALAFTWLNDSSRGGPQLAESVVHAQPTPATHEHLPERTHIEVDGTFPPLEFLGAVERIDQGEALEFRMHVTVAYRPNGRRDEIPGPRACHFIASRLREDEPIEILLRDTRSISIELGEDGEPTPLPDLVFQLPKSVWAQATQVRLELRGGNHVWPVPVELAATQPSAMLISLDSNEGFALTSAADGVAFDIDSDGDLDQVAWTRVGSRVAFLALDIDGDGWITSGRELFGAAMMPGAGNGPNALMRMSRANGAPLTGAVAAGQRLYERLLLWNDFNHNGVSDDGELRPAKELFTAIGMGYSKEHRLDEQGNVFRFQGWAERRTGGPDQGRAMSPLEQKPRLWHYYEVVLATR